MILKEAKWESETTGLKIGEIIVEEEEVISIGKRNNLRELTEDLKKFEYVFTRLPFRRELINEFLEFGFRISDIYLVVHGRNLPWPPEKIKNLDVPEGVIFTKEVELSDELLDWIAGKFRNSRLFYDLPEKYAFKIYRRWIREIIESGIFIFAVRGNDSILGFGGVKREDDAGKYLLLFSDKVNSFLILAKLFYECATAGMKYVEFKISLQNHALINKYMESLGRQKIKFEVVLSKVSEKLIQAQNQRL